MEFLLESKIRFQRALPAMHRKQDSGDFPVEDLKTFWSVDNMFTFEGIGFTNDVTSASGAVCKFLVCGVCEQGPFGFHDPTVQQKLYHISTDRVAYS